MASLTVAAARREIQPGLPSCLSLNGPPVLLVLKTGGFGSPEFFERAPERFKHV
ncbi:MAG: hypothetical protein DIU68_009590 [Chloroflexota bacterium]